MNIQPALVNPDKTPLTELEFTVVALYPGKTIASGDVMTKVMVDTPQGTPNCYVTFFTPQAPAFVKGDVGAIKADITPQGAKGVTVSEFPVGSGKKGINVNKEATWTVGGVAAVAETPQQPAAQQVATTPVVAQPVVAQPLAVVGGSGGSIPTKLTREELLRELSKLQRLHALHQDDRMYNQKLKEDACPDICVSMDVLRMVEKSKFRLFLRYQYDR